MCPHCGSENIKPIPWTESGMVCRDCEGVFELPHQEDAYDNYLSECYESETPTHHPNV